MQLLLQQHGQYGQFGQFGQQLPPLSSLPSATSTKVKPHRHIPWRRIILTSVLLLLPLIMFGQIAFNVLNLIYKLRP